MMPLQDQYHSCLASAVAFCGDQESTHAQHFRKVMGEAMTLLAVFMECLPQQFLACQSVSMLDGTTRMPPEAFQELQVRARKACMGGGWVLQQLSLVAGGGGGG